MTPSALPYREIWLADFEFRQPDGERPDPVCMVASELRTGRVIRLWADDLKAMKTAPFCTTDDALFVAFYASAEIGCFLELGWQPPARVLDLYAEFRCRTSGLELPCGRGLLGALAYHGLDSIAAAEKEGMRELVIRGGPYTDEEKRGLLAYCESDVDGLARLLPAMLPYIDLSRALLRGRWMIAAARIERTGIPVDVQTLTQLRERWGSIQDELIRAIDRDYAVFDGRVFKSDRFADYLRRQNLPWPRIESGALDLSRDAFHEMARAYPVVSPLGELRHTLSSLRLNDLAVGSDGRNRCLLSAFASKTGRNQPSNSKFIFGPSTWLRGLIKPGHGCAVAYIDYEQQEFGIAAALSGDSAMMHAYRTGDPYLEFARQAGAVPPHATKVTHKAQREQFKACALGVQYGMGEDSLARRLDATPARARELLRLHQETYAGYWRWSQRALDHAMLTGRLQATFGWPVHVGRDVNPRSLRNFPLQANGAEMLRIACCLATERGISVCAPVHDALLIEAPVTVIDDAVAAAQDAMKDASELVLPGFPLRTEAKIVRDPDRYMDPRGQRMWDTVMELLAPDATPVTGNRGPRSPVAGPALFSFSGKGIVG